MAKLDRGQTRLANGATLVPTNSAARQKARSFQSVKNGSKPSVESFGCCSVPRQFIQSVLTTELLTSALWGAFQLSDCSCEQNERKERNNRKPLGPAREAEAVREG